MGNQKESARFLLRKTLLGGVDGHGAESMGQRAMPQALRSMQEILIFISRFSQTELGTLNLKLETILSWEWIKSLKRKRG